MNRKRHSDLRLLALANYRGWIDRERYLQMRTVILDAITAGNTPPPLDPEQLLPKKPDITTFSPAPQHQLDDEDTQPRPPLPPSALNTASRQRLTMVQGVLGAIVIIALLSVIMVLLLPGSSESPAKPTEKTATESVAPVSPGE